MHVFWAKGYEGAALSDLTRAMRINRPSLYAAFGNKEQLFRKVLDRYVDGPLAYFGKALTAPKARDVIEQIFFGAARMASDPRLPSGCLMVQGALAVGNAAGSVRKETAARRATAKVALRRRLRRAKREGDLPKNADPAELVPRVKMLLHDLSSDDLVARLRNATLELAVMVQPTGEHTAGIEFESLRTYPWCVALIAGHPFARLKFIALEKVATEPVVSLSRKDYSEYYRRLESLFASISAKPPVVVECDSISSLILEVEAGRGIALVPTLLKLIAGKRLLYRPLTGTTETVAVGIARGTKGDVTPAGEKFCEILRQISFGAEKQPPCRKQRLK